MLERVDETEVLVHEADACRGRRLAITEDEWVAVDPRPSARVGLVEAGEHLDEGRLP